MKRFTKMLALGLATVFVFGMSVHAAPSPSTGMDDKYAETVDFTPVAKDAVETVATAVKKDAGDKATVVGAFEMNVKEGVKAGEVSVQVDGVSRGDEVWLYKYEDAAFTTLLAKFKVSPEAGYITFVPMDGCFYAVVNMGKAAAPSGSSTPATSTTTNAGTSPKTGETAPVAGVMALVLLAGAAFCAKKVRYNR